MGGGVDYKGVWEESDGTVLYLDCGVDSTTECVCQKSWNYTPKGCILLCVNYTSIKLTGKTKQNMWFRYSVIGRPMGHLLPHKVALS